MTRLDAVEARVVGSLIEKQLSTPGQYPLSANALVLACNQTSNREPVVSYTEDEVVAALERLRERKLARFVLPSHGRSVVRYRHVLDEALGLSEQELALLAVLFLRGRQTVGELRLRTERMAAFTDLNDVEHQLERLAEREEPLVSRLARQAGKKEERWSELVGPIGNDQTRGDQNDDSVRPVSVTFNELSTEVATLRNEVAQLRVALEDLRSNLGG